MKCFICVCSWSTTKGHSFSSAVSRLSFFFLLFHVYLSMSVLLSPHLSHWDYTSTSPCAALSSRESESHRELLRTQRCSEVRWTLTAPAAPHHHVGQLLHLETEPNQNDSFTRLIHFYRRPWMNKLISSLCTTTYKRKWEKKERVVFSPYKNIVFNIQ